MKKKTSQLPKLRAYGRIEFWVDTHHRRNAVVVECDDPNYPVIAVLKFSNAVQESQCKARAKRLLTKIVEHKIDYRKFSLRVPKWARWSRNYTTLFDKRSEQIPEEDA